MAINYSSVSEKIFRILNGSGYQIKMYDNQEGNEVANPEQARFFYVQNPNIMINLDDRNGEIKVHKGPADLDEIQKTLDLLRNLSKNNLLDFDLREFGREIKPKNYSFRLNTNTMSDNIQTEGLSLPVGTSKTSSQHLEGAKLLIKHRKPVDEEVPGSRSRNIKALYVENADGERFKYPFIHLNGARAMTRHVQSGGTPYDEVGQSITGMSEQLSKIREVLTIIRRSPAVQEQAGSVMNSLLVRQDKLRETVKRISTVEGYKNYTENFRSKVNAEISPDAIEQMKEKFTVTNMDNRIEELLPFITEVNDEENTLDSLRGVVKTKLNNLDFHEPTEKDVDTMPIQFTNDAMRVAARLALVAKLAKDDEVSGYLSRMAAKLRGEDKEPAGGEEAKRAGDTAPYRKDDVNTILQMLDDAKIKEIIKQVESDKIKMMKSPGDDAYDKAVSGESVLPELTKIEESFDKILGVYNPKVIEDISDYKTVMSYTGKDAKPGVSYDSWLKSKGIEKGVKGITSGDHAKYSREYQAMKGADKIKWAGESEESVKEDDVEENKFTDQRLKAIKAGEKEFEVDGKKFKVTGDTSDEKAQNETSHDKFSQTAQNKPIMLKGKQIDLDTVEYDMQDYSDMIFEPELGMKYTDGTEVADEDIEELMQNDDFVEWVRIDYMDRMQDQADMMRDSKEEGSVKEGGNAFDIAMTDAEAILSDASSDEEAKAELQRLHDDQDDSYAKSTVKDYIDRLEKEGLGKMQRDIAMADNAGPQESADPTIARMQELIKYQI